MGKMNSTVDVKKSNNFYRIPQTLINEANSRINLTDIVGETVTLEQVSKDQWKGLCPLHSEKTPSFFVNETKGFFHCFGCGESGNAISFLMKVQGMNFRQAAIKILQLAGIEYSYIDSTSLLQSEAAIRTKSVDKIVHEKLEENNNVLGDIYKTMAFWSDFCRDIVKDHPYLFDQMEEIYLKIDDNYRFHNYDRVLEIYDGLNDTIKELINDS